MLDIALGIVLGVIILFILIIGLSALLVLVEQLIAYRDQDRARKDLPSDD